MKIETVYNALISSCGDLFQDKQRLHNPYELSDNPEMTAKDSWGLKVGSASSFETEFCQLTTGREFVLVLIRQFATVGNKDSAFDESSVALLKDQQSFLSMINSPDELNVPDTIDQIIIETINGIEFMQTDQKKYLFCEIAFRIITSESVI